MAVSRRRPVVKARVPVRSSGRPPWHFKCPPGVFIFLGVAAFYCWTVASGRDAFNWGAPKDDHYNLLTDGFLSGHLYLAKEPPKELLALKDPWDPGTNGPYRLHDASLYEGRYYSYFGPVPVLTLFVPWRVIAGCGIPNQFAAILFLLTGYIFSCLLLFTLLAAADIRPSWLQKRLVIAALGLCQTAPIILRRANMYETAVAGALCFVLAGLYFLARYTLSAKSRPWQAWMAGWCIGFTPGCRPNYALVAVVVAVAYWVYLSRGGGLRDSESRSSLFRFIAPIVLCGLMLAWYNYARFGNPLNVGQSYQLVGSAADRGVTIKSSHFLPGLYRILVQPPLWMRRFPFAELATAGNFGAEQWPPDYDHIEPVSGLLAISPLCLAGIGLPLFLWWARPRIPKAVRFFLVTMYVAALANLIAIVISVNQVAQRYEADFAPSLLLLSLFVVLSIAGATGNGVFRIAVTAVLAVGVIASGLIQAALSINGYDRSLMEQGVSSFDRLAAFFGETSRTTRHSLTGITLNGEITFPPWLAAHREALLASGVSGRSNAIFIDYLNDGRLRFACFTSGRAIFYGPEIPAVPGTSHRLQLDTSSTSGKLTIKLDDVAVLSAPISLYPSSQEDATLLKDDLGTPSRVGPFSGEFSESRGLELKSTPR